MTTTTRTRTRPYDAARYLKTEAHMAAYLDAALEESDVSGIATALGNIAKARGMTQTAKDAGLSRESLYKALSPGGNPEMATFLKVIHALGLKLHVAAT